MLFLHADIFLKCLFISLTRFSSSSNHLCFSYLLLLFLKKQAPPQRPFRQIPNYKRWTESKQMMLAEDIDSVIRIQLTQVVGDNPYVEDFYNQSYLRKIGKAGM